MKNPHNFFEQLQSKKRISSKINSRNNSNLFLKKKNEIKSTLISRKSSNSKMTLNLYKNLIQNNLIKHNITPEEYNKHIVTNIIYDEQKHIVSTFKNFLIWDECSEFCKRYYYIKESIFRIPKIAVYYEKYTLINPIYFYYTYSLAKVMKRFMKKKKKYLELLEEQDDKEKSNSSISKEKYSTLLHESVLNHKSLISSINNQLNENESITLSKRSDNNISLSFNDLIEKTTIYQEKETEHENVKCLKKMPYKKIPLLAIANVYDNNTRGLKMPKINLTSLNRLLTENSSRSYKKKTINHIQCISQNNNLLGKMTNNTSINKANMSSTFNASGIKVTCNTAQKKQNKEEISSIQSISNMNKMNMNVNVNFNINFNINILNRYLKTGNKLVLSTQHNNLRHKMIIAGKDKIEGKTNVNHKSKIQKIKHEKISNTNNYWLTKNKIDHLITTQSTRTSKPKINKKPHQTIQSLSIKKNNITKPELSLRCLLKNNRHKEEKIPKILLKNYPLTARNGMEKEMPSTEFLAKLINDHHNVIKRFRSHNTSKG